MDQYKEKFIRFLLRTNTLKFDREFSIKSERLSSYFINVGDINNGKSSTTLGDFFADLILNSGIDLDLIYGIPEKGNAVAVATAISLNKKGKNVPWFVTRTSPKYYGEASYINNHTNARTIEEFIEAAKYLPQSERIKALVIGRAPKDGQSIVQLDDVFTAGNAKYEARKTLQFLGNFKLPLLAIAVDRQEVGIDGRSAIEEYEQKTRTRVTSIVNVSDIIEYLYSNFEKNKCICYENGEVFMNEQQLKEAIIRMLTYLRVYGTDLAKNCLGKLEQKINLI